MSKKQYMGKTALVIGLGASGRSASRFLLERGASVIGVDDNDSFLETHEEVVKLRQMGLQISRNKEDRLLAHCDFVVISPGISPSHSWYRFATTSGKEIVGEVELACRHLQQPFIGITGTNGKTTVSLLVGHVLHSCGKPASVLGNVGIPLTSRLSKLRNEIIVCELSSYQLETMSSRVVDVGVVLNITPDHLDRYKDIDAYAAAKFRLRTCLKPKAPLYVAETALRRFGFLLGDFKPKTYGRSSECDIFWEDGVIRSKENIELILPDSYRNRSDHEVENIMAAFAACSEMGIGPQKFARALETFKKPPHRIEFVREVRGVSFFNDSKGTNIDAVIKAVESMRGQVILIAGGLDKGVSYQPWKEAFAHRVTCICAIGQAKEKIKKELSSSFRIETCDNLKDAVNFAFKIAKQGENVLLSPGCASFDMYANYEHRGEEFKHLVQIL